MESTDISNAMKKRFNMQTGDLSPKLNSELHTVPKDAADAKELYHPLNLPHVMRADIARIEEVTSMADKYNTIKGRRKD